MELERGAQTLARRMGLNGNEAAALNEVATFAPDRAIGPAHLARRLRISTAAATRLVDRLERRGHLERHPHDGDRRRLTLRHTEHAEGVVAAVLGPLLEELAAVERGLSDEERVVILRFLRDVTDVWRAVSTGDSPGGGPAGQRS